jgi:isopentenyl-diphosphate delta-isomerase type 1
MSEELFDVVDEADRPLYVLPRSQVHQQRLRHRAIHVFVVRSDGCLLIHKRSPTKEEFPSVWTSSASGHVSAGESYEESAPRELREELGIEPPLERLHWFAACEATSHEFTVLYLAHCDEPIHFDAEEMTEIRWLPFDQIEAWIQAAPDDFSPAFRLLFSWFVSEWPGRRSAR